LFTKKGYDHTTFTDIAKRLGLTKGAVYWHFESKEKLLLALIEMALKRFQRQIEEVMPSGELTFPAVAAMMVENAVRIVSDPKGAAFFRLMKCQIRWTDASMVTVREGLLTNLKFGPKHAFRKALLNDMKAGRAKKVNAEEVSSVVISIWDGLVQAKLDGFLACDLETTIRNSYAAIWNNIGC